jgi:tetratricopeptide (TPR) repeat protein
LALADGRVDESIRWYSRAIEIAPAEWDGWRFEQSYEFLGDTAAAARLYQRAVSQRPADTEIAAALIRMLTWSGDTEAAMALLRDRLQRYPDDPYLHRAQAFYLYWTGRRQALASLRAAAPLLFSDPPELEYPVCYLDGPTAVFVSRQSGDTARASTIAAAVYKFADEVGPGGQFWANWMRVRTAAALGDRIGVAKYLDELYRMGSVLPAPILHEPLFEPYLNDPLIAPRLAKHAERRAEWRHQLAAEGL